MSNPFRATAELLKAAALNWIKDYAQSMGAALAFYTIFSIAPLLLIVIAIAGFFFGQEAAQGEIFGQLQGMLGTTGALAVQGLLESAGRRVESVSAAAVGVLVLFIGATSVFAELQDALDRIWRAPQRARQSGLWALVRGRLLSFGMILGIGFLLIVSLSFSAALKALSKWWDPESHSWNTFTGATELALNFVLVMAVFAMIYKTMPRVSIHWRDVWVGAAVTAVLFITGKTLIGLYIGRSGISSAFGAAASLIVVLLWVYYSAQIFLFGAEFTWVYSHKYGSRRSHRMVGANLASADAGPGLTEQASDKR
jgi:membrane protein